MQPRELIDFLSIVEKLKCNTRHCWTSTGRHESVAEHSWRLAVMALLVAEEFPSADGEKLVKMCLIHDIGEAITGDIPAFLKTKQDEEKEELAVAEVLEHLPENMKSEFRGLFLEISESSTIEAKIFKALDNLEAMISHNESPIDTWRPHEYEDNLVYGAENVAFSAYMKRLKEEVNKDSLSKIEKSKQLTQGKA